MVFPDFVRNVSVVGCIAGIVSCRCPDGHVGYGYGPSGCSPTALLPNPCQLNPCKSGGTCVVVSNAARCICHPHLTGVRLGFSCNANCIGPAFGIYYFDRDYYFVYFSFTFLFLLSVKKTEIWNEKDCYACAKCIF